MAQEAQDDARLDGARRRKRRKTTQDGARQEETRLAMVSVPESNFLGQKRKHKVMHLFNGNYGDFCETFSLVQLQQ
jgi:hypothetical protein